MIRQRVTIEKTSESRNNRFVEVLQLAAQKKTEMHELVRASLAEEFFRENPMPWLLDADPVDDPAKRQTA